MSRYKALGNVRSPPHKLHVGYPRFSFAKPVGP